MARSGAGDCSTLPSQSVTINGTLMGSPFNLSSSGNPYSGLTIRMHYASAVAAGIAANDTGMLLTAEQIADRAFLIADALVSRSQT